MDIIKFIIKSLLVIAIIVGIGLTIKYFIAPSVIDIIKLLK